MTLRQEIEKKPELGHVLVIDDDEDMGVLISDVAEDLGFTVQWVSNHPDFLAAFNDRVPTIIFVDLHMPDVDGIEILKQLNQLDSKADVFIMSGFDSRVLKTATEFGQSKGLRVRGSLEKPIDVDELDATLRSLIPTSAKVSANGIVQGIHKDEFFLRYQPKLTLDPDGADTVDGAEALIRWQHPTLGELTPVHFISIAEQSGLISELTDRVVELATEQIRLWAEAGLDVNVAINLSPLMLDNRRLPDRYAATAAKAGVAPSRITVEITESGVMKDVADTAEILMRFRLKEFGLSIDDFGTGFSSLVELYRMPFNELKIDRAFVEPAPAEKEATAIVRILTQLAKELGLTVCAEGAEDLETLEFLRQLGCQKVQGYVVSSPLLPDEFTMFVRSGDYTSGGPTNAS